jgi:hypothetical protein
MARFETIDDLLRAAPSLIGSGLDVESYLLRPGILSPRLRAQFEPEAGAHARPDPARRDQLLREYRRHPVRLRRGTEVAARVTLPPGEYDLKLGFRLPLFNETLAAAYAVQSIPHVIAGRNFTPLQFRALVDAMRAVAAGGVELA